MLRSDMERLESRTTLCRRRVNELLNANPELQSEYVDPAVLHAKELWRQVRPSFSARF